MARLSLATWSQLDIRCSRVDGNWCLHRWVRTERREQDILLSRRVGKRLVGGHSKECHNNPFLASIWLQYNLSQVSMDYSLWCWDKLYHRHYATSRMVKSATADMKCMCVLVMDIPCCITTTFAGIFCLTSNWPDDRHQQVKSSHRRVGSINRIDCRCAGACACMCSPSITIW